MFYGGYEPSRNRVVVRARLATFAGGIDSLESITGFLKSFKIRDLDPEFLFENCVTRYPKANFYLASGHPGTHKGTIHACKLLGFRRVRMFNKEDTFACRLSREHSGLTR
jgi:hypothetical protein